MAELRAFRTGSRLGTVHRGDDKEKRAKANGPDAKHEHGVRRRYNLDVKTVGIVPPVVEGRRCEHGDASPGSKKSAEGSAKAEDTNRRGHHLRRPLESS